MGIKVTQKDVKRADVVPPGWYVVEVKDVSTKPASTDQSTNFVFKIEILANDKGDESFAGTPTKDFLINEKGLFSSGLNFLVACGFPKETLDAIKKGQAPDAEIDEKACVGKKIKAFVKNSTYEGRTSNECADFLPL